MKLPKFEGKAFLAPMSGITDPAFRLLCRQNGASLVVTELTNVHAIVQKEKELKKEHKKITEFVEFSTKESPVGIQLFGNDIEKTIQAAKIVEPYFDVIDFNMGCPATHITRQMAGAALLQKPDFNEKLFSKLVKAVNKPVTLKMRTGVSNNNCYLYKNIAKIAQDCGVQMLTLHGRTVDQGYSGQADWNKIKELKEISTVPVVGNGDIDSPEKAKEMMDKTGCDYVMIGRAARGNPQIFDNINTYLKNKTYTFDPQKKINSLFKYLEYTKLYNIKFSNIKMQAMQFTKGMEGGAQLRLDLGQTENIKEIKKIFEEIDVDKQNKP